MFLRQTVQQCKLAAARLIPVHFSGSCKPIHLNAMLADRIGSPPSSALHHPADDGHICVAVLEHIAVVSILTCIYFHISSPELLTESALQGKRMLPKPVAEIEATPERCIEFIVRAAEIVAENWQTGFFFLYPAHCGR